jgi:hypothetical protein
MLQPGECPSRHPTEQRQLLNALSNYGYFDLQEDYHVQLLRTRQDCRMRNLRMLGLTSFMIAVICLLKIMPPGTFKQHGRQTDIPSLRR